MTLFRTLMTSSTLSKLSVTVFFLLISRSLWSIELPEGFVDEKYIAGMKGQVTGFDWGGDSEKVFIALKSGLVRVAVDGVMLDEAFIDLRETVNDRVDRGLLSIAIHPDFPATPYVYLLYTYDPPELLERASVGPGGLDGNGNRVARLDRYTADQHFGYNRVLAGSLKVLLGTNSTFDQIGDPEGGYDTDKPSCGGIGNPVRDCLPIDEMSHTIGAVRFAPDGSLYVTNGDGASYHDVAPFTVMVQDLDSMRGKVFRIDAETGQGLMDNPFFDGDPESNRSKVLNYGLRNPYSLAIHPQSGVPYVGEVGLDLWEEVNGGIAKNFAWPCYSGAEGGNQRRPDFEDLDYCQEFYTSGVDIEAPVLAWPRNDAASAMVGDFYFADSFPEAYRGKLFYADFLQGWMRYADVSDPANVRKYDFATDVLPLVELKLGSDGALYYASITTGEIRRIRYAEESLDNSAPNAVIFTSGSVGIAPLKVQFDASNSSDTDGKIINWHWDFGQGKTSDKEQATTVFENEGDYPITLTVTDNFGSKSTAQTIVTVHTASLSFTLSTSGVDSRYSIGERVSISGSAANDGVRIDDKTLRWQASIYNGENAIVGFASSEGRTVEFVYPDHADRSRVQICLSSSLSDSQKCELLGLNTVTLELDSYPKGLPLVYQSLDVQTPFIQDVPKGATRTVSPSESTSQLNFVRWSNGGQKSQPLNIQASVRLVANFVGSSEHFDYASAVSQVATAPCLAFGVCWQFFSNLNGDVLDESSYVPLLFADGRYRSEADDSSLYLGKGTSHSGLGTSDGVTFAEYGIARFVIGVAGEYSLEDSALSDQNSSCGDGMSVMIMLNTEQIHLIPISNGGDVSFNRELGTLRSGDVVAIALGPDASSECDTFSWKFSLDRRMSGEVAPVFQSAPDSPISIKQGEVVSLLVRASDANGDSLIYTSRGLPVGVRLDAETGRVSGQLDITGTFSSVMIASDGELTTEYPLVWVVNGGSSQSSGGVLQLFLVVLALLLGVRESVNKNNNVAKTAETGTV